MTFRERREIKDYGTSGVTCLLALLGHIIQIRLDMAGSGSGSGRCIFPEVFCAIDEGTNR